MTCQISFYHLSRTSLERTLPKLLEKVLEKEARAVVLATSERLKLLDDSLWTYRPNSFLPHGTQKEGRPEDHPIWLTDTLENPNQSTYLLVAGGLPLPELDAFHNCLYIFDGTVDEEVQEARKAWKKAKDHSHPKYWQQTTEGAWEEKQV